MCLKEKKNYPNSFCSEENNDDKKTENIHIRELATPESNKTD